MTSPNLPQAPADTQFASEHGAAIDAMVEVLPYEGGGTHAGVSKHKSTALMTVLLPVFNEASSLPGTLYKIQRFAAKHTDYRFIFVDDGSTDATSAMVTEASTLVPVVGVIQLATNVGKGAALCRALAAIHLQDDELLCFMDGDLAYSLDHLSRMRHALRSADVVIGSRHESKADRRSIRLPRRFLGWGFNRLVRVLMGLPYGDTQAGLKAFRAPAAKALFPLLRVHGFAFDAELLFLARKHGYTVAEVPAVVSASHRHRPSNVSLSTQPLVMLADLLRVRVRHALGRYRSR